MSLTYDEVLVESVKALAVVQELCGGADPRMYHLEVFQAAESETRYPCIVYEMLSDLPFKELEQTSGLWDAIYQLTCLSKKSATIRRLAAAIQTLNDEATLDAILAAHPNVKWIEIEDDSDNCEFATEQQDKGYRSSVLTVTLTHSGKL